MTATRVSSGDLMQGGSELVDLSMLAARARGAALRAAGGGHLDARDRQVLDRIGSLLEEAVVSVRFFASGGLQGQPPSGALSASIDAAIGAVRDEHPSVVDADKLAQALTQLAEASRSMSEVSSEAAEAHPDRAQSTGDLATFYGDLSANVLRQIGRVGETAVRL